MITISDSIKDLIGKEVFGVIHVVIEEQDMTQEWEVISGEIIEILGKFTINENKEVNYKLTFVVKKQVPCIGSSKYKCWWGEFDKELLYNNLDFAKKVCDYLNKKDSVMWVDKDHNIMHPSLPYDKNSMIYTGEEK